MGSLDHWRSNVKARAPTPRPLARVDQAGLGRGPAERPALLRAAPAQRRRKTAAEIHAVLAPLGLSRSHDRPFALGPPIAEVTVLVAAASGAAYPVDPPPFESRLPYPRPRDEPIRYRAEVMAPGEDFDQTGFELPAAPAEATGQGLLFDDDCSQPDSADAEPVFWTGGTEQAGPADDFVQADALEAV